MPWDLLAEMVLPEEYEWRWSTTAFDPDAPQLGNVPRLVPLSRWDYIGLVQRSWAECHLTRGRRLSPGCRAVAGDWFDQMVPIEAAEGAFILAVSRQPRRSPRSITCLRYFAPLVREILSTPISPDEISRLYWRQKGY